MAAGQTDVIARAVSGAESGDHTLLRRLVADHVDSTSLDVGSRASLLSMGAAAAWSRADVTGCYDLAERAVRMVIEAREAIEPVSTLLPFAVHVTACVATGRPHVHSADRLAEASAAGCPLELATPVIYALTVADRLEPAATVSDRARQLCWDEEALSTLAWVEAISATVAIRQGGMPKAQAFGSAALELLAAHDNPYATAEALVALAQVDALSGRATSCEERVREVQLLSARNDTMIVSMLAQHAHAQSFLAHGQWVTATRHLRLLHEECERRGMIGVGLMPVLPDLVEACRLAGDDAAAGRYATLLRERAASAWTPYALLVTARGLACSGEQLTTALELAAAYGNPFEEARTRLVCGRALLATEPGRAHTELRVARELFEGVGAAPWVSRVDDALGSTAPDERIATLTSRERQIVALAETGATTHEIATALFISPKTVENHLGNIYRKLGVRSKSALGHLLRGRAK